ncbi:hypothetical protein L596_019388 [Steinernema carpocapsae]|uniref:protein-serine/threonine phosphatase n=1 Tax=Steinernema carpocapsae TaxID=34508 RepID=A0A4V6A0J6_STECR|nr:hypothetical protein L596_019388 [Steinernema carpocapsae]
MNGNTRVCQPGCCVVEELNMMLTALLQHAKKGHDDRFGSYDALSPIQMNAVAHRAKELFQVELTLVNIRHFHPGGTVVIGDLDGAFDDLIAIVCRYGFPPNKHYVFMGNFVNVEKRRKKASRAIDSISCVMFIFLMKLRFPNHVTVLRGMNETADRNMNTRFSKQCEEYGLSWLYDRINKAFDQLPLACTVHGYFIAHGGISQFIKTRGSLKDVHRPIDKHEMTNTLLLNDLLNSKLDLNLEDISGRARPDLDSITAWTPSRLCWRRSCVTRPSVHKMTSLMEAQFCTWARTNGTVQFGPRT